MADRFFEKIISDVLDASEKLSNRLEEGLSALMTGELPRETTPQEPTAPFTPTDPESFEDELEIIEGDVGASPLEGIARTVLGDIMDAQVGPQTAMDHFHAFRHAVTWTEPFVLMLLTFHVILFTFCMFASQRGRGLVPRLVIMVIIGVIVKSAEWLNGVGAEHWRSFATQNYFDRRGIFVSIMLCGPLLLYSFIMLVFFLREAAQLLVQVKTAEIKRKRITKEEDKTKKRREKKD